MNLPEASMCRVERKLAHEKGELALFACFEPDDFQQWEIVVSAAWAPRHDRRVLELVQSRLEEELSLEQRLDISRIAVVDPSDEDVQRLNARFHGDFCARPNSELSEAWQVRNDDYFGYRVARGFVLASNDYWVFVKNVFRDFRPDPEFYFFTSGRDLHIRVRWKVNDPSRPYKTSRPIVIRISREALEDYIYVDDPARLTAERQLVGFLKEKLDLLRPVDLEHSSSLYQPVPPGPQWKVDTQLFERASVTV
jgi:hypothetical protein